MNPMAMDIANRMQGGEELVFSATRVARAVGGVLTMMAVPFGGAVLYNSYQTSHLEAVSSSLETVITGRTLTQADHAGGVATGLVIGGVQVPEALITRIEEMVSAEIVSGTRSLSEARIAGLEGALSGGWSAERLESYVAAIEGSDATLRGLVWEGSERLAEAGIPISDARTQARHLAVSLMIADGTDVHAEIEAGLGRASPERAAQYRVMGDLAARIGTHLGETGRIGGLDPVITRDVAIRLVERMVEDIPVLSPSGPLNETYEP